MTKRTSKDHSIVPKGASVEDLLGLGGRLDSESAREMREAIEEHCEQIDEDDWDSRWAQEVEDRIAAVERGEMEEISGEEVFSSLKSRDRS